MLGSLIARSRVSQFLVLTSGVCYAFGVTLPAFLLRPRFEIMEVLPDVVRMIRLALLASVGSDPEAVNGKLMIPVEDSALSIGGTIIKVCRQAMTPPSTALVLVGLVLVVFTLLYPVAKFWILARWAFGGAVPKGFAHRLVASGKVSMLDVYAIACFLLVTKGTGLLELKILSGVYFFAASVVLMQLSEVTLMRSVQGEFALHHPAPLTVRESNMAVRTVLVAAGLLIIGMNVIMFRCLPPPVELGRLEAVFLEPFSLSLRSATLALGLTQLGVLFLTFSVFMVWLRLAAILLSVLSQDGTRTRALAAVARDWSMLDVFLIAILVVSIKGLEGYDLIIQPGAILLAVGLVTLDLAEDRLLHRPWTSARISTCTALLVCALFVFQRLR